MHAMILPLLLGAFVGGAFAFWYFRRRRPGTRWVTDAELLPPPNHGGIYFSPAGENEERVARLLPTKPTEDVSHLLGDLGLPPRKAPDASRDYLPDPKSDWVVSGAFHEKTRITVEQVKSTFTGAWLGEFSRSEIYGREADTGRWTYALAGDVTGPFSGLQLAWRLYEDSEDDVPPDEETFANWREATRERMASLGATQVEASLDSAAAAARAAELELIRAKFDHSVSITLAAPDGTLFDGKEIWDVMLCLGLHWGDMDLFHWENPSNVGSDHHFSVWTSTSSGYFFPEQIARGETHVMDLVFGFQVARAARPRAIAEAMIRAANYAQSRLGGRLLDPEGSPFSPEVLREAITELESGLRAAGFAPGEESTLRLI